MASGSKSIVLAALLANAAIAGLKFGAYLLTGSASMLSETYHSLSDTGNQVLLLVGLQFALREPSQSHPFGWGKAEYFYAFVVAVLLFGIAGWESLRGGWDGVQAALAGHGHLPAQGTAELLGAQVPTLWISFAVLAGAFAFETYALSKAAAGMRRIQAQGRYPSLWATFRGTKDAAILTAFTEDILALVGLVVAAVGLGLAHVTGDPLFDAAGAMVIGALLMGFALLLAWEQKRLIVGEAMEPWKEDRIRDLAEAEAGVVAVHDLRTVHFGTDDVLVTLEVAFDDALSADDVEAAIDRIEAAVRGVFPTVRGIYIEPESGRNGWSGPGGPTGHDGDDGGHGPQGGEEGAGGGAGAGPGAGAPADDDEG